MSIRQLRQHKRREQHTLHFSQGHLSNRASAKRRAENFCLSRWPCFQVFHFVYVVSIPNDGVFSWVIFSSNSMLIINYADKIGSPQRDFKSLHRFPNDEGTGTTKFHSQNVYVGNLLRIRTRSAYANINPRSVHVKMNWKLIRCACGDVKINSDFHPNLREWNLIEN